MSVSSRLLLLSAGCVPSLSVWALPAAAFVAVIAACISLRYRVVQWLLSLVVETSPLHEVLHGHYVSRPQESASWVRLGRQRLLLLRDPQLAWQLLSAHFPSFPARARTQAYDDGLFAQEGEQWKRARRCLTPSFTPSALRSAEPQLRAHARRLASLAGGSAAAVSPRQLLAYCTDCVASALLGLQTRTLEDAEGCSPFLEAVQRAHDTKTEFGRRFVFEYLGQAAFDALGLGQLPDKIANFFRSVTAVSIDHRNSNTASSHDFIHLLTKKMKQEGADDEAVLDEVSSQTAAILSAGAAETSHVLQHCLLELAAQPQLQQRLRSDIASVQDPTTLPLLEAVVNETLRLHPSEPVLSRECRQACSLGGERLQPGDRVLVPVWSLSRDCGPHGFQPDTGVEAPQLVFGGGPRKCVGYRLGLLAVKIAVVELLSQYELSTKDGKTLLTRRVDNL
ncbi:cytochrome P450 6k1-like [Schistocerca serialis cubense]|uniref:cytochrome P450 6k1-like n=1 Tax=Schistocerca serialis cubense TaxID=2023355 RepID=UPI00214ECAB2|nr:cytochrome P450 6k1-like [Schistocerca serialis cubense]